MYEHWASIILAAPSPTTFFETLSKFSLVLFVYRRDIWTNSLRGGIWIWVSQSPGNAAVTRWVAVCFLPVSVVRDTWICCSSECGRASWGPKMVNDSVNGTHGKVKRCWELPQQGEHGHLPVPPPSLCWWSQPGLFCSAANAMLALRCCSANGSAEERNSPFLGRWGKLINWRFLAKHVLPENPYSVLIRMLYLACMF